MIKIDLITGFLGSGKTTFIKRYAEYLINEGEKICILENDFGAVNVDMLLLHDLLGENCDLEMVAGGCDADCHKRRFKTKLISMGMRGFERVLIEPSGIYDVDEFFDTLREEPLDNWYEIGNVITIVDGNLRTNLSKEDTYLFASQIANAGAVLFSKMEDSNTDIASQITFLNEALKEIQCDRVLDDSIIAKPWNELTKEDFSQIASCGMKHASFRKDSFDHQDYFQSVYFMNYQLTEAVLDSLTDQLFRDSIYGNVMRVKGFISLSHEQWLEYNATKVECESKLVAHGQEVVIVIGENLKADAIRELFSKYEGVKLE